MSGLEISEKFYREYGEKMLETEFGDVIDRIAVGLVGEGSECFGYDDELSADHDYEPAFCLWLTDKDEEAFGFRLSRAYAKLPKTFMGLNRQPLSPVGGNRHGVMTIGEFYTKFLGRAGLPKDNFEWLYLPEYALAEACNGKVFRDDKGEFTAIRNVLKAGYPNDVRLKKLAARCATASQAGQYNYLRCVKRNEFGAAQLAVFEFVKNIIGAVYLLNGVYQPYYKWTYRGMRDLKVLSDLEQPLTRLTLSGEGKKESEEKLALIASVTKAVSDELRNEGLSQISNSDLGKHAYSMTKQIRDGEIRNMHIMDGI